MLMRTWHGWTSTENAAAYQLLLQRDVFPTIDEVPGHLGTCLSRRVCGSDCVEFVVITLFESLAAVKAFAGDDHSRAMVPPEARRFLLKYDERALHYEVVQSSC